MQLGKFITVEGSEGAGKTSVISRLEDTLKDCGIKVVLTREPGGTELSERIRDLLLDVNNKTMHHDTEILLMFAARAQHWQEKILPALNSGHWVVSDRFVDSSFAYQGGGRGIDMHKILTLEKLVLGDKKPDLTLLLDLDPAIGIARAKQRNLLDRFEQEKLEFFNRVRQVFLQRSKAEPKRFVVIDAAASESCVGDTVNEIIKDFYVSLAN